MNLADIPSSPQEGQSLHPDQLSDARTYGGAALAGFAAVLVSTVTALTVIFLFRWRRSRADHRNDLLMERVPIQPAVNTAAPAQMPHHFSEDLLVPGLTHSGTEIAQQEGRNPEGV